jgi:hypothetical protein
VPRPDELQHPPPQRRQPRPPACADLRRRVESVVDALSVVMGSMIMGSMIMWSVVTGSVVMGTVLVGPAIMR